MNGWCRKCALNEPHPFRHWHVRCPVCRTLKVFRGPACRACLKVGREVMHAIMKEIREEDS